MLLSPNHRDVYTHARNISFLEIEDNHCQGEQWPDWNWAEKQHMNFAGKINVWTLGQMVKDQWWWADSLANKSEQRQTWEASEEKHKREENKPTKLVEECQCMSMGACFHWLHIMQAVNVNLFVSTESGAIHECDPVPCTVHFNKTKKTLTRMSSIWNTQKMLHSN